MCDYGGFSWCPATLDDMPVDLSTDMEGDSDAKEEELLDVDHKGAVEGYWYYRQITRKETKKNRLTPHGDDLAAAVKINTALRHWRRRLLLQEKKDSRGPALLVATMGVDNDSVMECRYIGAVRETRKVSKASKALKIPHESPWKLRDCIRIGSDKGKPDRASKILRLVKKTEERIEERKIDRMKYKGDSDEDEPVSNNVLELFEYVESSDEEYPNAGEDSSSRKGTPWYSRPGATEYRRPDITEETAQAWDEQISESAETMLKIFSLPCRSRTGKPRGT